MDQLVAVPEKAIDLGERVDDLSPQLLFLLLGELLFVDVDHFLDGDLAMTQRLTELLESLEREIGGEDRCRDLVLAFLDALGQRDFALAREERDPPHLAAVETNRVLGTADGAGGEIDGIAATVVVVLDDRRRAGHFGGQAGGLGGIHHLDVHGPEHHHDVVELIERDDVGGQGVIHLVVGEEALLLAHRNQAIELFELRLFTHSSELLRRSFFSDGSSDWATLPSISYTTLLSRWRAWKS